MISRDTPDSLATFSFVMPGLIDVSSEALHLAKAFLKQAHEVQPNEDWVLTFDWADSRRVRASRGGPWRDLGAGLDIAVYRRQQIPANAIAEVEGVEIAFKIPRGVFDACRDKRIDVEPGGASRVCLK